MKHELGSLTQTYFCENMSQDGNSVGQSNSS